jgi:hypothetical protein
VPLTGVCSNSILFDMRRACAKPRIDEPFRIAVQYVVHYIVVGAHGM